MQLVLIVNDESHVCDSRDQLVDRFIDELAIATLSKDEVMETMLALWCEGSMITDADENMIRLEFIDQEKPLTYEEGRNNWMEMCRQERDLTKDPHLFEELQTIIDVIMLTRR